MNPTQFVDPSSKLQRSVWWYLIQMGAGTVNDTVIANAIVERELPIRTVEAISFDPKKSYRPEGECIVQIGHHFSASIQLTGNADQDSILETNQRQAFDAFIGDTLTALNANNGTGFNDQGLPQLADALTAAGRDLASTVDQSAPSLAIAAANADMKFFRVDWVKFEHPLIQRAKPEGPGLYWVKLIRLCAFVSYADA